jgi:hypothetical protein
MTASSSMGSFVARAGTVRGVGGVEGVDEADECISLDSPKMASCVSFSLPLSPEEVVREFGSAAAPPKSSMSMVPEVVEAGCVLDEALLREEEEVPWLRS